VLKKTQAGLGNPRRALSGFPASLAARPVVADVHYHRSLAYRQLGDMEEADAELAKALELDQRVGRAE
jgi:Flp pilus assembly protein TadD